MLHKAAMIGLGIVEVMGVIALAVFLAFAFIYVRERLRWGLDMSRGGEE